MKIMYITSGHRQYPHNNLDQYIVLGMRSLGASGRVFEVNIGVNWEVNLFNVIREFKPDLAFTIHGQYMNRAIIEKIKQCGVKTGIWCVDDPYDIDLSLSKVHGYDYIFTTEKSCLPIYASLNEGKVVVVTFGTQTQIYYPEPPESAYASDLCLIGSPFAQRIAQVDDLLRRLTNVHFKLVGPGWYQYFAGRADIVERVVTPEEMRKFYNGARISLNFYRKYNESLGSGTQNRYGLAASTPNVRTFDIAACKSFQLTTSRNGLQDFFDLSSQLITFENGEDLLHKIDYYLRNRDLRERIAHQAYMVTRGHYRIEDSIRTLSNVIQHDLSHGRTLLLTSDILRSGQLLKGNESPGVFWVFNGYRHIIPSIEVFSKYGFSWESVRVVSEDKVRQFPEGSIFNG